MNEVWYGAITGGIAGGIAGLASFYIRKRFAPGSKKYNAVAGIVFVFGYFVIKGFFGVPEVKNSLSAMFDQHHVVKEQLLTKMQPLMDIPEIKKYIEENPSEAQTYMQKLVHDGLKRLDLSELETWNQLRNKMISHSPVICSGLWTGKISESNLFESFQSFTPEELDMWTKLSTEAAKRELKNAEVPIITALDFQAGVKTITAESTEEDRTRLEKVFAGGTQVNDADACWAMKVLLNVDKLKGEEKEKYLRYISML